jgi:FkbM family methyltransferase
MISYAQNFEDVMLWRALSHVNNGFYIDVGANDPTTDSVTRVFYENGWHGINIEPIESHFRDLQKHRPRDINIKSAAGCREGEIDLWECDVRGWATADKHVVKQHLEQGHQGVFHKVSVVPLSKVCGEFVSGPIHFLKIDVEGLEVDVLQGMDFERFRPWIALIEATRPNSQDDVYHEWEDLLTSARYTFAYADGLNRYYVANEHSNLLAAFRYPPNVFDEFVRIDVLEADARAQAAESRAQEEATRAEELGLRIETEVLRSQQLQARIEAEALRGEELKARVEAELVRTSDLEDRTKQAETNVQRLQAQLVQSAQEANEWHERVLQLHRSTSWRITKPLRVASRILAGDKATLDKLRIASIASTKNALKPILHWTAGFAQRRPALKRALSNVVRNRSPKLYARLAALGTTQVINSETQFISIAGRVQDVGPYAGQKVAVLAPGAADGTLGGAERFYEGLAAALRHKGCDVDLIYKIFDESSFETIKQGYESFGNLDLSRYDLVVSTKAPTYVIRHPNHVIYLLHTIRVFYDMFDEVFPNPDKTLLEQRSWIHKSDKEAFERANARFSLSREVSRRMRLWNGCDAEVLYPEIVVDGLYDKGIGDYFYMPGRLHPWKRVDLAIQAVKLSKLPLRLVISGTGESEAHLRKLADNDSRIEFLGRVDDQELRTLYANALGVPFLPIREDYGYVTLEAFACGKPVITCEDSGEPIEFVIDGETGFVCRPDPPSICAAFERLWNDRELAFRMGKSGREKISQIEWSQVASRLLKAGFPQIPTPSESKDPSLKVAVLDMQPIMPPVGGGRLRLLGLYHGLGSDIQTRYVGTYDWPGETFRRHAITPTLEEIDVPLSPAHHQAAAESARKAGGKTVIDMLFAQQAHLSRDYLSETLEAVEWADVVVFSHPWVAPLVDDQLLRGKTVIYDSQNVEAALRSQLLDLANPFERSVLDEVIRAERLAGDHADLILACSREDVDEFVTRYGWDRSRIRIVPNGAFSRLIQPGTLEHKKEARKVLGVPEHTFVSFFIGSAYAPNVEAALFIVNSLAPSLPELVFVIGGGACSHIPSSLPANVRAVGFLEEQDKARWLHASDIAINPMFSGSGTNIKMFDFMAAGLPVVTTSIGARGIARERSVGLILADQTADFSSTLRRLSLDRNAMGAAGKENRSLMEKEYAWETISPALGRAIRSAHRRTRGVQALKSPDVAAQLRVAHLSTTGLKCGIGEYTGKIIEIYQQHGISNLLLTARTANEEPNTATLHAPANVVWFFDNVAWKDSKIQPEALASMRDWGATHLVVQYHPGFFSPEQLLDLSLSAAQRGVAVTVVVHNFIDSAAAVMRRLNELNVRLYSHRTTEVAQALALGVVLDQIPLGIDIAGAGQARLISNRNWKTHPPTITTTGFLRKHKGAATLIRAMPDVLRQFPGAKLRLQCALYPSDDSRLELEACNKEISRLGIEDSVVLDTRFLDKDLVFIELKNADIAVLPYENSDEGGSATATDCMAVGLPLIVSNAQIFDEIRDIAFTTPPDAEQVSNAIIHVLSNPALYNSLAKESLSHAKVNCWNNIAGAFIADRPRTASSPNPR